MVDKKSRVISRDAEETHVRSVGFLGLPGGGAEGMVDVKDGKIVRIRPATIPGQPSIKPITPLRLTSPNPIASSSITSPLRREIQRIKNIPK